MTMRLLLWAAAAAAARAGQDAPAPAPAEGPRKDSVELKCTVTPGRGRPSLRLEGQAPTLPDAALLHISLFRIEERSADGRLVTGGTTFHTGIVRVERKKFLYLSPAGTPPGHYRVAVRLAEETQGARSLKALKDAGVPMPQEWTFDFAAWGDDLAGRLSPALREIDAHIAEAHALIGKFAEAAAQKALWEANFKTLDREAARLLDEIGRSEAKRLYPAACGEILSALDAVQSAARFIAFRTDGTFDRISDYHTGGKPTTYRNEEFSWDVLRKYLSETPEIAGREMALWVIKDARRAGQVSPELAKAVKDQAAHPGLSPYSNRLQEGARLDELEKLVREKK